MWNPRHGLVKSSPYSHSLIQGFWMVLHATTQACSTCSTTSVFISDLKVIMKGPEMIDSYRASSGLPNSLHQGLLVGQLHHTSSNYSGLLRQRCGEQSSRFAAATKYQYNNPWYCILACNLTMLTLPMRCRPANDKRKKNDNEFIYYMCMFMKPEMATCTGLQNDS